MQLACLDLEGVLVPEIWIEFSKRTNIPELSRTTRDEPDYDRLMQGRLAILAQHRLGLADIQKVIAGMQPLEGAREFLDWLRGECQVVILSDTYYQFAAPLMRTSFVSVKTVASPSAFTLTTSSANGSRPPSSVRSVAEVIMLP